MLKLKMKSFSEKRFLLASFLQFRAAILPDHNTIQWNILWLALYCISILLSNINESKLLEQNTYLEGNTTSFFTWTFHYVEVVLLVPRCPSFPFEFSDFSTSSDVSYRVLRGESMKSRAQIDHSDLNATMPAIEGYIRVRPFV